MKKFMTLLLVFALLVSGLIGCGKNNSPVSPGTAAVPSDSPDSATIDASEKTVKDVKDLKIAYLTQRLGDNASSDAYYSGVERFMAETGVEVTVVEPGELQDYEVNARLFCQEGYDLIVCPFSTPGELLVALAQEFPDTHFYIYDMEIEDMTNVSGSRARHYEAGFLTGVFNVLMSQELGGEARSAFVGAVRDPNIERSQYAFMAGSEYVGGQCTSVYVGSFADLAKGKEIALQLYQDGHRFVQAFAGGSGLGVYQAAEAMPEGYYALGAANGQFNVSERIIASMAVNMGEITYTVLDAFGKGTLEPGFKSLGYVDNIVSILYAPGSEDLIPQSIKDQISELESKIISGEIVPPTTEEEYNAFAEAYLKK